MKKHDEEYDEEFSQEISPGYRQDIHENTSMSPLFIIITVLIFAALLLLIYLY